MPSDRKTTAAIRAADRRHLWHPYTRFSSLERGFPVIVGGRGIFLHGRDGRRYLDAISSWWACALGHGHPRVVRAIRQQAAVLQHSILGHLTHPGAVALAGRLARLMPTPDRHVLFSSDGASAVEAALKIALQYGHQAGASRRTLLAHLADSYHGDTLGAVAVGYLEAFHRPFKPVLVPGVPLPLPGADPARRLWRPALDDGALTAAEQAAWQQARRVLERNGRRIAALIVEPICQGAAGMRMYSPAYLRKLAALCRAHHILLIADEIATGFGRTGRWFAFEHAGVDPDIVCVGKALSAGYLPISAAIVKDRIYRTFADTPADHTFYHGHTFSGNPIAAAAALAALEIIEERDLPARAREMERRIARAWQPLAEFPAVLQVRCLGAIGAIEFRSSPRQPGSARAQLADERLRREGVLTRPLGPVLYVMPPLTIPWAWLDRLLRQVAAAVTAAAIKMNCR